MSGSRGEIVLPDLFVDPAWLEQHRAHPRVRIVDLREKQAYDDEHIPGAVHSDLAALGQTREGCENVLLCPADFESLMGRLGIASGDTVVCYDAHWGLAAARLVWALHRYGHASVSVLNGGWDRWREERLPVSAGAVAPSHPTAPSPTTDSQTDSPRTEVAQPRRATAFEARPDPDVSADFQWLQSHGTRADVVLLDTRAQTEFDQGHLPEAVCWDWFHAVPVASWHCSRGGEELRSEWAGLGVLPSREIVTYCRSGMRAAHTYMVLRQAGFPRVRLYDGSWQDWSSRRAR